MIDNLVALVGKQPMPILIPILQFKPKKSWLIVTKETEEHAKNIRDTIKLCNKQVIALPLTCRPVSPYIPEEVEQEIGKIYQQPESNTYINMTYALNGNCFHFGLLLIHLISALSGQ